MDVKNVEMSKEIETWRQRDREREAYASNLRNRITELEVGMKHSQSAMIEAEAESSALQAENRRLQNQVATKDSLLDQLQEQLVGLLGQLRPGSLSPSAQKSPGGSARSPFSVR